MGEYFRVCSCGAVDDHAEEQGRDVARVLQLAATGEADARRKLVEMCDRGLTWSERVPVWIHFAEEVNEGALEEAMEALNHAHEYLRCRAIEADSKRGFQCMYMLAEEGQERLKMVLGSFCALEGTERGYYSHHLPRACMMIHNFNVVAEAVVIARFLSFEARTVPHKMREYIADVVSRRKILQQKMAKFSTNPEDMLMTFNGAYSAFVLEAQQELTARIWDAWMPRPGLRFGCMMQVSYFIAFLDSGWDGKEDYPSFVPALHAWTCTDYERLIAYAIGLYEDTPLPR